MTFDARQGTPVEGRIRHVKGSAYEVGLAMGRALGPKLSVNIDRYVAVHTRRGVVVALPAFDAGAPPT